MVCASVLQLTPVGSIIYKNIRAEDGDATNNLIDYSIVKGPYSVSVSTILLTIRSMTIPWNTITFQWAKTFWNRFQTVYGKNAYQKYFSK